ncbi:MAG: hypothetical protein V2I54_13890 [Bacteroidales bacterium]|nr:hypothetical protein [Bacteroidales bacterium]
MFNLRIYSISLILILLGITVNGQHQNEQPGLDDLKSAFSHFEQGNYTDAYDYFNQMLKRYPKDPSYNYYAGICRLFVEHNPENALQALRYASTQDVPDDVYFYLGLAYHRNYQFDEALKNYLWFQQRVSKREGNDYALRNYISMAQNGIFLIQYGKKFSVYSKENIARDKFYQQYRFNDLDGKFTGRDEFFEWKKDSLSENTILFVPNALERNEVLYFAAKHKVRGDYDIFRITKLSDTAWSKPVNLGEVINTPFDENYPFIHSDGSTLYFASKGHYSMGGYDIYESSWDWDRQVWSEPENLGFPMNSPFDDFLYVPSANHKLAMMTSNREGVDEEYTVYKFDPEYYSPYIELNTLREIKQLARLEVNAALDSREGRLTNPREPKKNNSWVKPSLTQNFLHKPEYDSLMNLAVNYQLKADSLRWIIDDKREAFDNTPDGQSRAKLSNQIIALEQQVYITQKKADECYQRVREIEQKNMASQRITYGFSENNEENEPKINPEKISEKKESTILNAANATDSLHKIEYYTDHRDQTINSSVDFGLTIKNPSRYTAENPIPVNEQLPDGIVYMIQLGAFSSAKNASLFKGLEPLSIIQKNSSIRKYYAGKFRNIEAAEKSLPRVKANGFADAFVVAFRDGKVIPVNQAVELEAKLNRDFSEVAESFNHPQEQKKIPDKQSIIYTLSFRLIPEDSLKINEIKNLLPDSKDIYLEDMESGQKVIIKSFLDYKQAFAFKDQIEAIVNKEVEVIAFFAEHQIPLDQAVKLSQ